MTCIRCVDVRPGRRYTDQVQRSDKRSYACENPYPRSWKIAYLQVPNSSCLHHVVKLSILCTSQPSINLPSTSYTNLFLISISMSLSPKPETAYPQAHSVVELVGQLFTCMTLAINKALLLPVPLMTCL